MPKIIISDTSVLILFHKIQKLSILEDLYGEVITTKEVIEEFGEETPDWIKIQSINDKKYQKVLETQIDSGEASAMALASEYNNSLLLIDDLKARKLAEKLGLKITGTLGVIVKAKKDGVIQEVKPIIQSLLETNFRISDNIVKEILKLSNE